nr:cyclic nucleotide-binding domain-containing protein 2 [Pelodiscus sinensis]XP_025044177.1 cyclic nucleotide-binding domain-containing protein 2 [Pelodiscus sinensis]XP_025044178.1 cyclic nucleotide-binding domain-containing protein 2 [Pelodiscus sinensis]|eukprot:XP_025044176.1 cyclic nucleotide-binding domain-containing protein 2 [Pelodiscus sinensis]
MVVMNRVCKIFRQGLMGFRGFQFIDMAAQESLTFGMEEDKKCTKLSFDHNTFQIRKDRFPLRAIQITKKKPEWRTEKEIKLLQSWLQFVESYRRYSLTLQLLLAKVIRFERFGRRRVIVKKGHCGQSFYFIYFGTVAITEDEDGSSAFTDPDPTLLRKGAGFGEVALLKARRRIATVVCMEETELLVVDKEDFFANKLDEELRKESQYRFSFFKGLDLFATWPNYLVEKIANYCKAENFHYGQVIVKDISESASIIFVTKGKCEVLRLVDLTTCPSYHKWISQQMDFPKPSPHYSMETGITGRKRFNNFMWKSFPVQDLSNLKSMYVLPFNHQKDENLEKQDVAFNRKYKNTPRKLEKQDRGDSIRYDDFSDDEREVVQKEILGLFQNKLILLTPYGEIPTAVATAIYTKVDEVHKGELLGISQHLLPEDKQDNRSMVLVSQGAEVIRLKKEKFEKLADHITLMKLHKKQTTYPSDDELCQSFLEQNHWKIFKKDLMNLLLERKLMMAGSQHVKPKKDIYSSWSMNQAGILDLTSTHPPPSKSIHRQQHKYVPIHIGQEKDFAGLPDIQLRLIHGIAVPRPSLKGLF